MKKTLLILLISSCAFSLYAQDTDSTQEGKVKVKNDKVKIKDADGKVKVKGDDMNSGSMDNGDNTKRKEKRKAKMANNDDMGTTTDNADGNSKMKIKNDKTKIKDADGKVKIKTGDMNSGSMNSGMGTMNSMTTTTNTTTVTMGGWTTNPANLPVVGNNVSADVVSAIKNKYGATVYDIKQIRSTSGQNIYVVRVMENGSMRTDYVGADANTVSQ